MIQYDIETLERIVADLLAEAKRQGATQAEAGVHAQEGLDVTVRLGETESVEHSNDHGLGVTVYFDHRKGSANTTDLRPEAIRETVAAACSIARHTSEDPAAGLADPELMAREISDLDLDHPWEIDPTEAANIARRCEEAARAHDPRICNSEGATVHSGRGLFVYGNTHGFVGGYPSTRHSISCAILAEQDGDMQRDYWYTNSRVPEKLKAPESVGEEAARRAVARLNPRKIDTTECPVLFKAEVAAGLMYALFNALRGPALYRRASFLLDMLGEPIFPDWVRISENPHIPQGLGSAPFDNEGVATLTRDIVSQGVLRGYILDSYSARKLGTQTTGNAGGVRNPRIDSSGETFEQLITRMGRGLLVTELMGQGSNTVTGDYSRGAAGFWIEDGRIAYPVAEITVAGNLRQMFDGLLAVGCDNDIPGAVDTGSWLIDRMTVAGN
ncbi:MAG: metalloprotease PmbA [Gammaproteobacteria bacterium]|nr:MAG: metalloprotease PmbA [Gammaproteobacteria bacterium]